MTLETVYGLKISLTVEIFNIIVNLIILPVPNKAVDTDW